MRTFLCEEPLSVKHCNDREQQANDIFGFKLSLSRLPGMCVTVEPVLFAGFLSVCADQVSQNVSNILGHLQFWPGNQQPMGLSLAPGGWPGDSNGMAAPDMLFGLQGMDVPACPVGCYHDPADSESTPGQASTWGPYTPCTTGRPDTLVCCGGPNRAQKTVKSTS
jgi:hypothetical protein